MMSTAEKNQVVFLVVDTLTAVIDVVNVKTLPGAAHAAPAVASTDTFRNDSPGVTGAARRANIIKVSPVPGADVMRGNPGGLAVFATTLAYRDSRRALVTAHGPETDAPVRFRPEIAATALAAPAHSPTPPLPTAAAWTRNRQCLARSTNT
jgi:hypothetical protein